MEEGRPGATRVPRRVGPGSLDAGDAPWTAEGKHRSRRLRSLCALSAPVEKWLLFLRVSTASLFYLKENVCTEVAQMM